MANYVVCCPHCGNTVTVQGSTISKGHSGGVAGSCVKCHKTIRIEIRDGNIWGVSK